MDIHSIICGEEIPSFLIFDFSTPPPFLYYAYIPIICICLFLGLLVLIKNKASLQAKLLFGLTVTFSLWVINIIVQWIASYHNALMFAWELTSLIEVSIYILALYFISVFINQKDISMYSKIFFTLVLGTVAITLPTALNVSAYDINNCEGIVGPLWSYIYAFEVATSLWIIYYGLRKALSREIPPARKAPVALVTLGLSIFLGLFTFTNISGEITKVYEINLIGPLGMAIFLAILSYTIIRYKAFNVKLLGAQVLVGILWILVFAILFIREIDTVYNVIIATLILITIIGYMLIRNVKKERAQLEQIAKLAGDLEKSNKRLRELDMQKSEFVSIASHQLRGPLTAIKGYTSLILEGDIGNVDSSTRDAAKKIFDSAQSLVGIVNDFLDISRIEQGRMKYDFAEFDMKELLESTVDEFKPVIEKKGLSINFTTKSNKAFKVNGDKNKLKQVINNLIDNSIKYTPEGSIKVCISKDEDNVITTIIEDSGVGMGKETIDHIFEKFSRAKNASATNVIGTGLGLYVAKEIVKAHHGKVWAASEGEGKGSQFYIELQGI